jgi:hypothetical protein
MWIAVKYYWSLTPDGGEDRPADHAEHLRLTAGHTLVTATQVAEPATVRTTAAISSAADSAPQHRGCSGRQGHLRRGRSIKGRPVTYMIEE